jgi:hypothetical protein
LSIFLPITTYSLPQLLSFVLISSFIQVVGRGLVGRGGREGGREGGGDDDDHGLCDPSSCGY